MADKIAFTDDSKQIVSLWSGVFGDSAEDIYFFLNNCIHKSCLGYFKGETLVSMLFLVECSYCGKKGAYLYAVSTRKNFRGRGYVSKLIERCKNAGYDFLWLIPANDTLFGFYERFGFKIKLYSNGKFDNRVVFDEKEEICEYLYDGSEYDYPRGMIYSTSDLPEGSTGFIKYK